MIAVLCALQVRQNNFLPVSPSDSLAHAAGTGHVQHLLLGVGEGGHGLLYVAQLDLVPLVLYRSTALVPMLGLAGFPRLTPLNCES